MTSMFAGNDSSHAAVVTLLEPPRLTFVCTTNPTSSNASSVSVLARKTRGAAVVLICGSCGSGPPAPTNNGACSHVSSEFSVQTNSCTRVVPNACRFCQYTRCRGGAHREVPAAFEEKGLRRVSKIVRVVGWIRDDVPKARIARTALRAIGTTATHIVRSSDPSGPVPLISRYLLRSRF